MFFLQLQIHELCATVTMQSFFLLCQTSSKLTSFLITAKFQKVRYSTAHLNTKYKANNHLAIVWHSSLQWEEDSTEKT